MAKKPSFSYLEVQGKLEAISSTTTKETLVFDLLSIFCGYGEGAIRRIIEGHGNESKEERTIVIKKLLAYRYSEINLYGEEDLYAILDNLRNTPSITRKEPRLYIASDGHKVVAYDPIENDIYENEISLLWRDFEFFKPLAGIEKIHNTEEAEADVRSSEMVAKIYDEIRRHNDIKSEEQVHCINVFMTRLLFCFFAEDTGIFPEENMFTTAIKQDTKSDASDFEDFIGGIFDIMSIESQVIRASLPDKISKFPYVNGGLFSEHFPIPTLSSKARALIIKCGESDWKEINPDIFGSMIQAVVQPEERSSMGVHYTSVPNIMKVIKPLFLDDLASDFIREQNSVKGLQSLRIRLSKMKFFDPACGSGNFLVITYKRIRELEIAIWKRLHELGDSILPFSDISLTQFFGIELSEYACDTAKLSLWLAEHQMNVLFKNELGVILNPLPLKPSGTIVCGNACEIDWNKVCPHSINDEVYVFGNPPYLGSKLQDESQKKDIALLFARFGCRYKDLDYICCWFLKGCQYILGKQRFAFVATNSITQGEQVPMLWPILYQHNVEICFAYKDFKWSNNAKDKAGVTCVIIGMQIRDASSQKYLFTTSQKKSVNSISPYLIEGNELIVQGEFNPIQGFPTMEVKNMTYDGGQLIFSKEEKDDVIAQAPQAEKFFVKLLSGNDILDGLSRYSIWVTGDDVEEVMSIPLLAKRINAVRHFRENGGEVAKSLAKIPYQFRFPKRADNHLIMVPTTTSERRRYLPVAVLGTDTIITHAAYGIYDSPLWVFAILSSRMHMLWAMTVCGKLGLSLRYSSSIAYNVFPFPSISEKQKKELEDFAEKILVSRESHSEMTLSEMYNPETMPPNILRAHLELDSFIERLFKVEPFVSDEERLAFLFKEYKRMIRKKDNTLWKI